MSVLNNCVEMELNVKELKLEKESKKMKRISFSKTLKPKLYDSLQELADEKNLSLSGIVFLLAGERLSQLKQKEKEKVF